MKRILTSYIGTVRGLQSHIAAQMYPGKVVSLEQHKKEKPPRPPAGAVPVRHSGQIPALGVLYQQRPTT